MKRAFPLTLPYVLPLAETAERDGRAIGVRDSALFVFFYRFLARSNEDVNLDIEDLAIGVDRITVSLDKDKTDQNEDQTLVLMDRPGPALVPRIRRWLAHLAVHGITEGSLFRHLLKNGQPAIGFRATVDTERGDYLRPKVVRERLKHWFAKAELATDGCPVSSQGFRAGAATDLAEHNATAKQIAVAGRWKEDSTIPERVYLRPAKAAQHDVFSVIPTNTPDPA
ncbi:tyrosine-type recombinase/integrase [Streptomyces sp. NBC_00237]|uniref:tyrosine-type recombinase/integrase n=1 Tax=Streptomyces sp. NBC_00237 TaxID=2975687 RepID=UPI002253035B|nr:tyrosine-type recombinase/integrase [Streptomyces sp. NBC_00237]MCX5206037.1 tyrosine-type recombinase/integrase [Streptomyces sp. NBC_00237]